MPTGSITPPVTAVKMTALRMAWKGFAQRDDEQMTAFRQFVAEQGDSLFWQAAFDALHAQQVKEDEMRWGWPAWPDESERGFTRSASVPRRTS